MFFFFNYKFIYNLFECESDIDCMRYLFIFVICVNVWVYSINII